MRRPASATPARSAVSVAFRDESLAKTTPPSATWNDRSPSSNGSRWATESQLAICKNPSFPIQQTAPKPYLAACAEITPKGRNWNAEFQLAWEMENDSIEQAELRMRILHQIERDFEGEAAGTIVKIVRLEKDMPAELLNFVQCFRVRNIFFRILPDSRSGRNYIASLRGILQSDSHLLSVPLSTMFYYRGMPVLAQALVPMTKRPKRLYGANSTNDVEVEAELAFIAEALHIPLPDTGIEVYEALDGRYYVTNSNATLTPLFVDDTIMKRQEMLRVCPEVVEGADNTMEVLDDRALQETVLQVCCRSTSAAASTTLTQVCESLHARGVNLCLLKQVAHRLLFAGHYDMRAVEQTVQLLACEMICRAVKQEFYIEIQGKRMAYDELFLTRTLSKYFALVFAPSPQFRGKFLDVVSKKYGITAEDEDLIDVLVSFRTEWKQRIMDRVCHLLGATIRKENGAMQVTWRPFANSSVIPRLVDPAVAIQLAAVYNRVRTDPPHWYAFCLPLRWKVACWQRNFAEALSLVCEDAAAQEERTGPQQLIRFMMERSVCHVSFQTHDWHCIQDGRSRFPAVLAGYEQWASRKTQGRRCIEYGFWLVDVAEALMEAPAKLRSCVEEAVHYFYSAIARMPAYLRSEHGAWLHLQPYMGLLRCKKLLPSCSVDTHALVQHSVELSKVGWASDFFINYLSELGRQLEYEGNFADAIQVLLTAISLSKEKPTFAPDLHTLLADAAHVYRSWDLRTHADACLELTNEAVRYAAKYYGVESREYGVALNNRGSIEIELGWLGRAEETLRNAGAALNAAGVPHGDPDYIAYARNLETLWRRRHPSQPRPTHLPRFLRRFPFLESACEGVPWDDVRPIEDGRFSELARNRAQEAEGTKEAYRLEADMKQRVGEIFRVLLSGATLKQYPFLPAKLEGVYVEGLALMYDRIFLELATQWNHTPAASPARHLQERRMIAYASVKARRTADRRAYEHHVEDTFLELFGTSVNALLPVDFSEVVEDAEVQSLMNEYERLKAHRAPTAELEEAQARIGQRVDAFESEQWGWRRSISAWVPERLLHSCFLRDFSRDGALRDLLTARQHATHTGEIVMPQDILEARIEALCMSIWERGQLDRLYCRSESHQLQQRYRLSSPRLHLQPLSAIFEDLLEPWSASLHASTDPDDRDRMVAAVHRRGRLNADAEYLEQWYPCLRGTQCPTWMLVGLPHRFDAAYQREQLQWQTSDGSNSAVALVRLRQYLAFIHTRAHKARVGVMRGRIRAEAMYPFLRLRYGGVHVLDLALGEDRIFCEHYAEYTRLSSEPKLSAGRLKSCEESMKARAAVLAQQLRKREAALQHRFGSYLSSGDAPLQWSSTFIEYTPRVLLCEKYYLAHSKEVAGSKAARDSARCAHRVRRYIRHMSQDQFQRRLIHGSYGEEIAERYPYLSLMPIASVSLSTLPFECRHEFRMLHATLFAPLRDTQETMEGNTKRRNEATTVPASPLSASLRSYRPESVATKTRQLMRIVEEMAQEEFDAQAQLLKAFPGIPHAVLGVPTTQLVLPPNFEQQWSRAAKEGFNGPSTPEVYSALVECATFARALPLARQYLDELALASQPFLLYTTRQCVSLRHLPLRDDGRYSALFEKYGALLERSPPTSPECSLQRVRLAARADQLALRATRQWDRLLRQFPQPPALSDDQLVHLQKHPAMLRTAQQASDAAIDPHTTQAILEELENQQRQDTERAIANGELYTDLSFLHSSTEPQDVTENSTLLRSHDTAKRSLHTPSQLDNHDPHNENEIHDDTIDVNEEAPSSIIHPANEFHHENHAKTQVARTATPPEYEASVRLTSTYPFLRLHEEEEWAEALVADEAFQGLAAEHADLVCDPEKNAAALRAVEDAMNERGDAVAAALRRAAAMDELASRYPFLRLHEEEGWAEALGADEAFQRLAAEHADLVCDPEKNAAALRAVEDAMNERGDAVAAALRRAAAMDELASRYPFLRLHEEEGWAEALGADEAFQRLAAEYADLVCDPEKNAAALRAVEDAMNERGDAVAAALRRAAAMDELASRYPFLRLHEEEGWAEALGADEAFQRLAAEYADLVCDPEKNAAALRAVEDAMNERGDAVAAALRRAAAMDELASRYPFLRLHEEEGWAEALVADEAFQRLAAEYADLVCDPRKNAAALRAVEDAMNERGDAVAAALRRAAAMDELASRYPFLRLHEEEGWAEALVADEAFQRLAAEYADLVCDPRKNAAALRAVEDAMNERGDAVAAALRRAAAMDELASRYPFLRLHEEEGWAEALGADEAFQGLAAEYADLVCDPRKNAAALRAVEDAMNERGDAVAAALRRAAAMDELASRYPFLRLHEEEGWAEALGADEAFQGLAAEYADLVCDPRKNAAALRAVEDAMNERGDAVAAALRRAAAMDELASRYPFLRLHEEGGWAEALVADEAFQRLAAEHADLVCDPEKNAAALRAVEDAMNERGDAVAAALRRAAAMDKLASRYPFLRLHEEEGWAEALVADEAFQRLAAEHADLVCDPEKNAAALRAVEDAMNERGDAVAAALRRAAAMDELASRYPFLRLHEEEGWAEALGADEAFQGLAAEYADLVCDPRKNAAALRAVEDAMNERGDAVAAALRRAAAMDELASRYPFLRLHEEEGWAEALGADEAFQRLAAEHADLVCDPEKNAAALRAVEDAMNERGDAVAAALRRAAAMDELASRYPFLRLHEEEGWAEALGADEAFQRLAAEHADLVCDPEKNAAALRAVEDAMNERGDAVAAALRRAAAMDELASRYPFLRLHEEEGWAEALGADEAFQGLAAEYADLVCDPRKNAAALRAVEDAMNERGDAVAAALRRAAAMDELASRYPFLRLHEEEGWAEALGADEAFQGLAAEHADLVCDPEKNAAALRAVEDAMNERGDAVAAALRRAAAMDELASRYPFLRLHEEEGWAEALGADEAFQGLAAEYADLVCDPRKNAAALRAVEDAMNERGDAVAAALRRAAAMDELASRYPFLRLHEEEGWAEALGADEAFQRLAAEHADLVCDPEKNAAALRAVEDAMNERGDAVAAALRRAAAMDELASRYPFLRLHEEEGWAEALGADEAFQGLAAEYADLVCDPRKNAAALRAVEDAMNERGDAVAAALRRAAAMDELASRYPFLRLHEEEGWAEALGADEAFQRLAAEHADLVCDPEKNAAALRAVEDAMNERGDAVAAALRRAAAMDELASRYPFLRLHEEEGWAEALVADEAFQGLAAEYADLVCDPRKNAAALRAVEDAMNERGDAVAAALRRAAAMDELASRYPFLRLHEEEGWAEALVADEAFQRLAAEYADLVCDPEKNAAALRAVEDAMNERGKWLDVLLSEKGFCELLEGVIAEETASRSTITQLEGDGRGGMSFAALVETECFERNRIKSEEVERLSSLHGVLCLARSAVSEAMRARFEKEFADCVEEEAAGRKSVQLEAHASRVSVALEFAQKEEEAMRCAIDDVEESAALELADAALQDHDAAVEHMRLRLHRALADCVAMEGDARGQVAADEDAARFSLAAPFLTSEEALQRGEIQSGEQQLAMQLAMRENRERGVVLRKMHSRLTAFIESCMEKEAESRSALELLETRTRETLSEDAKKNTEVLSLFASRKNSLFQNEVLAREGVELDEKGMRESLKGEWQLLRESVASNHPGATESCNTHAKLEATEVLLPMEENSSDIALSPEQSVALLQRVGRGRLLRKKLQRRLENRRRDILKQGVSHILAEEFTGRRTIVGNEYLQRQGLRDHYDRAVPMTHYDDPVDAALQQLMITEESERDNILSDYILARGAIERAEHKQFLKQKALLWVSGAPESSDDEEVADLHLSDYQGTESTLTAGSRKNRSRTRYKGFELDALGRFLLDYEKDINQMQTTLADFRRSVAIVHDQLKDARDRAAQEIVRGGTGAIWVPARPLPLADLVRGPNTQYEGKRAHRAL
ncbi:Flagellar Member 3 [Leishmania donovani]|uniref:Flagellar_Member_3/GeneDB:LmjF.16.1660 n=1 Tax=Leishmania donovani TaxID=5661 RepID=A0A6J8FAZ1_LEIDO|nr:Flagellar Member 3 [Leishmania donovani]VDZ43650.1 Flagellar_Member_3/GeneDB:LmjF.16.1660 [Leishmania donovani]